MLGQFSPIMHTLLCPVLYTTQSVAKLWYKSSAWTGQPPGDQFTQGGAKGILTLCFLQYFSDVAFAFATCEMSTLNKDPPLPQSRCNVGEQEESLEASPYFPSATGKYRGTTELQLLQSNGFGPFSNKTAFVSAQSTEIEERGFGNWIWLSVA